MTSQQQDTVQNSGHEFAQVVSDLLEKVVPSRMLQMVSSSHFLHMYHKTRSNSADSMGFWCGDEQGIAQRS
jgi:hypothetical protein